MKLKKILLVLIMLFFIDVNSTYAADYGSGFAGMAKNKMQKIELKKAFDVTALDGYSEAEGMTVTDKYFVIVSINTDDDCALRAYDKSTYKLVKTVKNLKIGHGNDLTYNPKTNKIYCAQNKKQIVVINADSLTVERYISTDHSSSAITYDTKNDRYLLTSGNYAYFYDGSFKYTGIRLNISTNLTRQNVAYYDGYYFRTCFEAGGVTNYQEHYEGILRQWDNLIYVFDEKANLKNTFYIPNENVYGEIEAVTLRNGLPFILYNIGSAHAVYTPKWSAIKKTITLKVESDDLDSTKITNKATLYDSDGKALSTKSISGGKYTFDEISYSIRGTFNYTIKIDTTDVQVDKNSISTSVKVIYDPVYNKLEFSNYKEETVKINSINLPPSTPTPSNQPSSNNDSSNSPNSQTNNNGDITNPQTGIMSITFILLLASVSIILAYYNKKMIDYNN